MVADLVFRYLSKYKNNIYIYLVNKAFKALNDQTRREILYLLKDQDLNAGDISEHFKISKPSISHHLDLLRQADLVTSTKKGTYIIYSINTTVVDDILNWIINLKNSFDEKSHSQRTANGSFAGSADNISK